MTNTNTTPNDTDRTTERTRSTPRAPARALPRRALPPLSRARASVPIHPRPTGPVAFFIVASPRAHHIDRLDREYEATDRSRRFLSSRHRARTTSIRLDREYEAKRHARVRVRVDVTSRASPPTRHRSPQRHLQYGGLWWYTHPCIRIGDFAFTLRTVCPCSRIASTRPLATDRPTARPRADVEAGTHADDAFDRAHVDARSVERELDAKTPFSSFVRRSIAERHRTRRACPRIHSFIHSEGG